MPGGESRGSKTACLRRGVTALVAVWSDADDSFQNFGSLMGDPAPAGGRRGAGQRVARQPGDAPAQGHRLAGCADADGFWG